MTGIGGLVEAGEPVSADFRSESLRLAERSRARSRQVEAEIARGHRSKKPAHFWRVDLGPLAESAFMRELRRVLAHPPYWMGKEDRASRAEVLQAVELLWPAFLKEGRKDRRRVLCMVSARRGKRVHVEIWREFEDWKWGPARSRYKGKHSLVDAQLAPEQLALFVK